MCDKCYTKEIIINHKGKKDDWGWRRLTRIANDKLEKIWINISRCTNCEVALLRPFIPLALHNCILPYQVSSAIIARVVLKLVSWLVEQHVAIPVAMTSFRVTVDCKTMVYWKSTAKPVVQALSWSMYSTSILWKKLIQHNTVFFHLKFNEEVWLPTFQ